MSRPPCTSRAGESKKRWPNQDSAVFLAHKIASSSPHSQAVYHCEDCDGWHLATYQPERPFKRRQELVVHGHENLFELLPHLAVRRQGKTASSPLY